VNYTKELGKGVLMESAGSQFEVSDALVEVASLPLEIRQLMEEAFSETLRLEAYSQYEGEQLLETIMVIEDAVIDDEKLATFLEDYMWPLTEKIMFSKLVAAGREAASNTMAGIKTIPEKALSNLKKAGSKVATVTKGGTEAAVNAAKEGQQMLSKTWGGQTKLKKTGGRAAVIVGGTAVAAAVAYGTWKLVKAMQSKKCRGLRGDALSKCKVSVYKEALSAAKAGKAQCKDSKSPGKCMAKVDKHIKKLESAISRS